MDKLKTRDISIDVLKFFAVFLIINSYRIFVIQSFQCLLQEVL